MWSPPMGAGHGGFFSKIVGEIPRRIGRPTDGRLLLILSLSRRVFNQALGNFFTFSEIAFHFHVGLSTMTVGVVFAAIVGVLGGFFPARSAAKKEILGALHEA
jgi:ABC-type antimicrobial peptide transport system permease subunit